MDQKYTIPIADNDDSWGFKNWLLGKNDSYNGINFLAKESSRIIAGQNLLIDSLKKQIFDLTERNQRLEDHFNICETCQELDAKTYQRLK